MVAQIDSRYVKARPSKLISRLVSYALFEGRPLTTRGQWINPLLFAHFALQKRLPQSRKVDRPLFIIGTGRSGTTILGVLLSMHRDVGFLNEPKAMWHAIYPDEDVIGSYSRGVAHYRLDEAHADDTVKRNAHRIFGAYLTTVCSQRLVDKYPELVFRVPFVREVFPDAQFIFLVRNGWDTCASIDKWSERCGEQKNGEVHDWWGVNRRKWELMIKELIIPDPYFSDVVPHLHEFENHSDMAALEWIVTMREGLNRMRQSDGSILMIHYEHLVRSPEETLDRIAKFAGFSEDEGYLKYGGQMLHPAPMHAPYKLHPALMTLFDETMEALGY